MNDLKPQNQPQKKEIVENKLHEEMRIARAKIEDSFFSRKDLLGVSHTLILPFKTYLQRSELRITLFFSLLIMIVGFLLPPKAIILWTILGIVISWYFIKENPHFWRFELLGFKPSKDDFRTILNGKEIDLLIVAASTTAITVVSWFLFVKGEDFTQFQQIVNQNIIQIKIAKLKAITLMIIVVSINFTYSSIFSFIRSKSDGIDIYAQQCAKNGITLEQEPVIDEDRWEER